MGVEGGGYMCLAQRRQMMEDKARPEMISWENKVGGRKYVKSI